MRPFLFLSRYLARRHPTTQTISTEPRHHLHLSLTLPLSGQIERTASCSNLPNRALATSLRWRQLSPGEKSAIDRDHHENPENLFASSRADETFEAPCRVAFQAVTKETQHHSKGNERDRDNERK